MTTLIDDCLLLIFDLLDPLSLASAAQVCKRWEALTKRGLKDVKVIMVKSSLYCPEYGTEDEMLSTNFATIKSALHNIGPNVEFVGLHTCQYNTIAFNDQGYYITGDFDLGELVSTLALTSSKITKLQTAISHIDSQSRCEIFEQLFKSNGNLKKLFLRGNNLVLFPSCAFKTVEKLIWEVTDISEFKNFTTPFINLKELTFHVFDEVYEEEFDIFVRLFLPRIEYVKSLTFTFLNVCSSSSCKKLLSDVSALTQLEELHIWNSTLRNRWNNLDFVEPINQLIESCPNLRVLKLNELGIGAVNISLFLALNKLEELRISNLSFFSPEFLEGLESKRFEHLTTLQICYHEVPLNFSGLRETIGKMPALKYLLVSGLPKEKSVEFTCEVIRSLVSYKDIIGISKSSWKVKEFQPFRLHNVANSPTDGAEPLRVRIGNQGKDYRDEVHKFVQNLRSCSVDVENTNLNDIHKVDQSWYGAEDFNISCDC